MSLLHSTFEATIAPSPDLQIFDWARENIDLPASYQIPGRFHVEKSRHLIEPFKALYDDTIRRVVLMKAIQTGGTLVADIYVPWVMATNPGNVMWIMQTDDIAKDHSESRMLPVMKRCAALQRLLPDDPRKIRIQEILFKSDVALYIQGPSINNLQSKSIRVVIGDEVWLWEPGVLTELIGRQSAYRRVGTDKGLFISQAGKKDDQFDALWQEGSRRIWTVQCEHCRDWFEPRWTWEVSVNGTMEYRGMRWDDDGHQVRYQCPLCGECMVDTPRLKANWNLTGRFSGEQAGTVASFKWNCVITDSWQELVAEFRKANLAKRNGSTLPLQQFLQKKMAEPWDERMGVEQVMLLTSAYTPGPEKWEHETHRFMTVDVQKDYFVVVIRAWANDGSSRLLHFDPKVSTWPELRELQTRFGIIRAAVDEKYGIRSAEVRKWCFIYDWIAFRGSDKKDFPNPEMGKRTLYSVPQLTDIFVGIKDKDRAKFFEGFSPEAMAKFESGNRSCIVVDWAGPTVRDIFCNLRDGKGAKWEAYDGVGREYNEQLYGFVKRTRHDPRGNEIQEYHVIGPDHAADCESMQVVVAAMNEILAV